MTSFVLARLVSALAAIPSQGLPSRQFPSKILFLSPSIHPNFIQPPRPTSCPFLISTVPNLSPDSWVVILKKKKISEVRSEIHLGTFYKGNPLLAKAVLLFSYTGMQFNSTYFCHASHYIQGTVRWNIPSLLIMVQWKEHGNLMSVLGLNVCCLLPVSSWKIT